MQQKEKLLNARRERRAELEATYIPRMDELTDEQWQLVQPLLPPENTHGRPAHEPRLVLNGILFYIRNSLTWINIPPEFPSYVTCFRRYHEWKDGGVLEKVVFTLTRHLERTSGLDFYTAWKTRKLSIHIDNGVLTIYLPTEYSDYWMQPTAVLMMMWMFTFTIGVYQEAYSQTCKQLDRDRLKGRQGPRSVRPRIVEYVVGKNPHKVKLKLNKPNYNRDRLDFIEKMAGGNPHRKSHPSPEHNGRHPERSEGSLS